MLAAGCNDAHEGHDHGPEAQALQETDLGEVPGFELVDQSGEPFSSKQLEGRVWAVGFIFTRCPSICPLHTALMREVQDKSSDLGSDFRLVSFSVDPAYDTPEVLAAYAQTHKADLSRWSFLTGDPEMVEQTVVEGLKTSMGRSAVNEAVVDVDAVFHGTKALLIDQEMKIRGLYSLKDRGGLWETSGVDQLVADGRALLGRGSD